MVLLKLKMDLTQLLSISTIIKNLAERLAAIYPQSSLADQNAWHLLEAVTRKRRATLIKEGVIRLQESEQALLDCWLNQLIYEHKPLQYILGSVPFGPLEIITQPPTLIPRPETEEWCMFLIEQLKPFAHYPLSIIDLCTGSGCIGLTIAKMYPQFHVYSVDISQEALNLAQKNRNHNQISNITFIWSDLFKMLDPQLKGDLIVANPPYIAPDEWQQLDKSVKDWEDYQALVAVDNGFAIIRTIIEQAPFYITQNNVLKNASFANLWLEIGYQQKEKVVELMRQSSYSTIQVFKDITGNERVVTGSTPDVALTTDK